MSTKKSRNEYIEQINEQVRENGNTNVLLVHAIAQHLGLSATEFECCSLIQEQGPFTAGELARRCRISTGGMTGMIDRLERRGYVRREADPNDRRRVLVFGVYDEDSIYKVRALYDPMQHAFDEILASYSDEEIAFIYTFLARINAMFHESVNSLPSAEDIETRDTPTRRRELSARHDHHPKRR
jgi:DNA-binding MarR family transcriptional regulator